MATEPISFEVDKIPGLAALAEEVQRDRKQRALKRGGETLAYLAPPEPEQPTDKNSPGKSSRSPTRRRRSFLTGLLAIADSGIVPTGGPADVSENKQRYLAEAYAAEATRSTAE